MLPDPVSCSVNSKGPAFFLTSQFTQERQPQRSEDWSPSGTREGRTFSASWPHVKLFPPPCGHLRSSPRTSQEEPAHCHPGAGVPKGSGGPLVHSSPRIHSPPLHSSDSLRGSTPCWACRHRGCKPASSPPPTPPAPRPGGLGHSLVNFWGPRSCPGQPLGVQASAKTLPEAICLHQFSFRKKIGLSHF